MSIASNLSNNITTSGVFKSGAVNNTSVNNVTSFSGITDGGGIYNLITTNTASNSASLNFTSSIDSTYKVYVFKFSNIHPATDSVRWTFQVSTDGGSSYSQAMQTNYWNTYSDEGGSSTSLGYRTGEDQNLGTSYQNIGYLVGADADQCIDGELILYNPSSTTFSKHFVSDTVMGGQGDYVDRAFVSGYVTQTSALNAISFKFSSGNVESGSIKMYGIS